MVGVFVATITKPRINHCSGSIHRRHDKKKLDKIKAVWSQYSLAVFNVKVKRHKYACKSWRSDNQSGISFPNYVNIEKKTTALGKRWLVASPW